MVRRGCTYEMGEGKSETMRRDLVVRDIPEWGESESRRYVPTERFLYGWSMTDLRL